MSKQKIGFIGVGVMGASIVKHLLKDGYEVNVYNRTKSKADEVVSLGAIWQDTPKAVTIESDIVFTIVGYPKDVEEVYYSEDGIFAGATSEKILVDMTTSTPSLAQKIFATGRERKIEVLDAPVSGGDLGAKNGTLTIMVGGTKEAYQIVEPIFNVFSGKVKLQGAAGSGQHTKMANQIMIAGTMVGMSELLVYANAAGLELESVLDTVGGGSAQNWSLTNYAPRILREDFTAGFFVKHFVKDLKIALAEAEKMDIQLPGTSLAKELYEKLENQGHGNDGTQALIKLWWPAGVQPKRN
ncbi:MULTISPECIES: NAD(P)-dependent oxidoreductase [Carnobacterium]|uniref:NAD(P)-dependent oxidoreductase n=2 Tax=Carnobacterium TaxID=2747 RepID=A0AAW9K541_CARML|nr:NAD(P)-dependent oxidoreductase [Carnobacterium maltaromaticum]MCC4311125.1 oxidoreductase [Carnobacterium maltaromaticum]MDT1944539.1 NAD(P)-dependent oxidoreductase [Carnobacterium maltaromaticum]MDT1997739.1 NAD(P)-dependent oxidoreductase [Carnobacterium maltaromaticum]MDW5522744.1 NAD(P)-dependent oxidoreductase [Carnobacterium maltaromaticum]MDZ5758492.1 NAD(P)-dependent oxidoreductase [Carnobacterium maltaromaticum]